MLMVVFTSPIQSWKDVSIQRIVSAVRLYSGCISDESSCVMPLIVTLAWSMWAPGIVERPDEFLIDISIWNMNFAVY